MKPTGKLFNDLCRILYNASDVYNIPYIVS